MRVYDVGMRVISLILIVISVIVVAGRMSKWEPYTPKGVTMKVGPGPITNWVHNSNLLERDGCSTSMNSGGECGPAMVASGWEK